MDISTDDLELLNSKYGLRAIFSKNRVDYASAIEDAKYNHRLHDLQIILIHMQTWAIENRQKIVVIFEGRDAAGKGGAIRRITEHINPRHFRIVALDKPTDDEQDQWYFQRYVNQLPLPGEIVFFDRSWYNRAVVEPVHRFCTTAEYELFMTQVNEFEKMIIQSGTHFVKLYFSITKKEQGRRFDELEKSPLKRWKMTDLDREARKLWNQYTAYKEVMFEKTNTDIAPWYVIDANDKRNARLETIQLLLDLIPHN